LIEVQVEQLVGVARSLAASQLSRGAEQIDATASWPEENMRGLAEAGLMGLHVPVEYGGHGQGLVALAMIGEELATGCSSTAMCFGMHSVATKVLAAKATPDQAERFLRPIAAGQHITSLALSEPGTGVNFFLPRAQYTATGKEFILSGQKSFVTSGGHADSYVVSCVPPGSELDPGAFTCMVVEGERAGLDWQQAWHGMGMRGNSSRAVKLTEVAVPKANLIGSEGDQIWYIFEVVAPYFLIAMSGVYLGIARRALEATTDHLKSRQHEHTGDKLSDLSVLQHQVANAWIDLQATRQLVHYAARRADAGASDATLALFAAKARVGDMAGAVTTACMEMMGGRGYSENSVVARLHRDALAAPVMSPTTHLLKGWLGRSLLDLPVI
jgi:alkylation response protein AidB-like acyl-CoA dehydrogenase